MENKMFGIKLKRRFLPLGREKERGAFLDVIVVNDMDME